MDLQFVLFWIPILRKEILGHAYFTVLVENQDLALVCCTALMLTNQSLIDECWMSCLF